MKNFLSIPLLCVVLFACGPQSEQMSRLSAIYQENDIEEVSNSFYRTEKGKFLDQTVGSLVFADSHICTAFLIDKSTIATADHCYADILHGLYTFRSALGEFKVRHSPRRYKEVDVVLLPLVLDDYIGDLPYLDFGSIDLLSSVQEYSLVSRTGNFTMTLSEKLEKPVGLDVYPMVKHTLDTVKGGSGSPIIQDGKVVAIHVGYSTENNYGVLSSYIAETEHSYEMKETRLPQGFITECAACEGPDRPSGRGSDADGNADAGGGGYDDGSGGYDGDDGFTDYCDQDCQNNRANSRDEATEISVARAQQASSATLVGTAIAMSVFDGPLPFGDIAGASLLIGSALIVTSDNTETTVEVRTSNRPGNQKSVEIRYPDGKVKDINPQRVKEWIPEPRAESGLRPVKFDNPIPGSKGKKRNPTKEEVRLWEQYTK